MKLTEQKLRRIIAEEYQKIYEEDSENEDSPESLSGDDSNQAGQQEPEEVGGDEASKPTDSASKLRLALKNLSMDASKFKGVDAKEAAAIADAINRLLNKASEGSAASIFSRLGRAFQTLKI